MVDSSLSNSPENNGTDMGVGVDDIPQEVRDRKLGSSSKKPTFGKVNVKPLDDGIRKALKPNKNDDPFNSDNWNF
jgi:hypothetical protein